MDTFLLTSSFALFLWPITTAGGFAVNYSFVLGAAILTLPRRLLRPPTLVVFSCELYSAIFILGIGMGLLRYPDHLNRQICSFLLFMSVFSFAFTAISERTERAFQYAVVWSGWIFSAKALVGFFLAGGNAIGAAQKDIVGSQRFAFIYLLAFYILLHSRGATPLRLAAKSGGLILLAIGILLTFSRASIVALLISGACYVLWYGARTLSHHNVRGVIALAVGLPCVVAATLLLDAYFPLTFTFFRDTIVDRLFVASIDDTLASGTSEGSRIEIWTAILSNTARYPLLGTGYLGSYVLEGVITGSAHNQYMDVLLRTGVLGFFTYMYLLYSLMRFLWHNRKPLFWGVFAMLIFGLFHETFKEPQGGFVLAFLIGLYSTHMRAAQGYARTRLRRL